MISPMQRAGTRALECAASHGTWTPISRAPSRAVSLIVRRQCARLAARWCEIVNASNAIARTGASRRLANTLSRARQQSALAARAAAVSERNDRRDRHAIAKPPRGCPGT
jgi:hypothetical protein